jgi:hypothetical protein
MAESAINYFEAFTMWIPRFFVIVGSQVPQSFDHIGHGGDIAHSAQALVQDFLLFQLSLSIVIRYRYLLYIQNDFKNGYILDGQVRIGVVDFGVFRVDPLQLHLPHLQGHLPIVLIQRHQLACCLGNCLAKNSRIARISGKSVRTGNLG